MATGQNPRAIKEAKQTQQARLLTVLVEFNPEANDDFSGFERLTDINGVAGADCVVEPAGTLINGPLHDGLPNPATNGNGTDNNTFWVEDFERAALRRPDVLHDRHHRTGPSGPRRS